ncbi:MAG: LacI family DNA-binding transcriptional regulator [Allomuricauda sp.]|jgi:LacI family transcriptional regulator|uniref:LacI family DNA-binding transcriptional regulator n=1 Tax=Allomuricauda sp. CP2A TaxID=1848189 RepID=UPI0009F1F78D|nr:LacI family DNA-binding transcriptional regulator [Muricauda sp. CP2A]
MCNITLKEMGKLLGYSASTISKALNDSPEISEATKAQIKRAAQFHNYTPNGIAQSLKGGGKQVLNISVPKWNEEKCQELLKEIVNLSQSDYERGSAHNNALDSGTSNRKHQSKTRLVLLRFE